MNVIVAYGPRSYSKKTDKERFLEELANVMDDAAGEILVIGDLNARVGKNSLGV